MAHRAVKTNQPKSARSISGVDQAHVARRPVRANKKSDSGFLLALGDALRPLAQPAEIEAQACRLLAEYLRVDHAHYAEINECAGRITIVRDAARGGHPSLAGDYPIADFSWALGNLQRGQCNVVDNTRHSPLIPSGDRQACTALNIIAFICAPVLKEGRLVGALVVTNAAPRLWTPGEVRLVQEVAERLWAFVLRARAEETLQLRTAALERQTAQLRRLASELTLAEHRTRELLSRTLHDGLQQQLYCAAMSLDGVIRAAGADLDLLHRVRAELQEAINMARTLSVDLFPPVLHNDGLPDALDWLVSWAHRKYGMRVEVAADPVADPEAPEARILLFESVRELVFNAVKHARVQELRVCLCVLPGDDIEVVVTDDGVGFDPERTAPGSDGQAGLGLFSIGERLSLLGGQMWVDSAPGHGARFTLRVPRVATRRQ